MEPKYRAFVKHLEIHTKGGFGLIENEMLPVTGLHFFEGLELTSISIDSKYGELQDIWLNNKGVNELDCMFRRVDIELLQWTGLKDRNGVEIYEGDIVGLAYGAGEKMGEIYKTRVVKWGTFNIGANGYEYDFQVVGPYVEDEFMYDMMIDSELIVIGNIYENPELLKEE